MKNISTSPLLSLLASFALLIAPLPIKAIAEDLGAVLSESFEEQEDESAIYLGKNTSNIIQVITAIRKLDPNKNTLLDQLLSHIKQGHLVANYDAVFDALEYAENVLHEHSAQLSQEKAEKLFNDFELLTDKVFDGELDIDPKDLDNADIINDDASITRARLRTMNLNRNLTVRGKGRFRRHLHTREGISAAGRLYVGKNGHFRRGVNIDGTLSARDAVLGSLTVRDIMVENCSSMTCAGTVSITDILGDTPIENMSVENLFATNLTVESCMDNLCVNQLSVSDAFINNATIENLSITSSVLDSVINHLTISQTLSSHDAVVDHATVGTLSATDAVIDNLTVNNCMTNLCVNNLSGTNQSLSGTLSVNNEVINGNLRIPTLSPAGVMHNDAFGNVSSSPIINTDISPSAAIADSKLNTISSAGKVANSATTATHTNSSNCIVQRNSAGNFSAGSVSFTDAYIGNLTTATPISSINITNVSIIDASITNNLSVNNEVINGNLQLSEFTAPGVLHNDALGNVSSSLIVNADVATNAAIADSKLAIINTPGKVANAATSATTANISNTIVLRNASGNFSAGSVSFNDAVIGNLTTTTPIANINITNLSVTDASITNNLSVNDEVVNGNLQLSGLTTAGVLHNDILGNVSSSLIVNADVATNAAIADTKLALINTPGKVANAATSATTANISNTIVLRNASGNFSAGSVSFNDSVIGNLTTTTPIANINITNLSVTDASITNNLSVNDEVINGNLQLSTLTPAGVLHNDALGNVSSSLIVNADVSLTAAITDSKLATISTAGKVANTATTATSANTPNTIVLRDGSGNFSAGAVSFTDAVIGNLTTTESVTSVSITNVSVTNQIISGDLQIVDFTTPGVLHNDASGNVTSSLIINDDVSPTAAIVDTKLATISTAGKVANGATTATSVNTPNTIVLRDGSGNFSAGAVSFTDAIIGNLTTTTPIANINITNLSIVDASVTNNLSVTNEIIGGSLQLPSFSSAGVLHNDASGNVSSSLIVNNDVATNAAIADSKLATISTAGKVANAATTATSANTPNTIVLRDGSGNFSAGAVSFTDAVIGNLTTTTPIANINITNLSVIDASITNNLSVTNEIIGGSLQLPSFSSAGVLHNDASGTISSSLIVNNDVATNAAIDDSKLATISTAGKVANAATTATSANTPNTIVLRDGSGNFSAGSVSFTDAYIGNLFSGTSSTNNFSGSLLGDVTGTQTATVVSTVGGQAASSVAAATTLANAATSSNTNSTIVRRSESGGFSASAISSTDEIISNSLTIIPFNTAGVLHNSAAGLTSSSLIVNNDIAPSAGIVDTKLATIATAGKVLNTATTAVSTNTASAIVTRDASGNFAAGTITANLIGNVTGTVTGSASLNVLKTGDTMTGTLTHPAGTAAAPAIQFTGSTNTGISAPATNTLSFDTNGVERMSINTSSITLNLPLALTGPLYNQAIQVVSPSLISTITANPTTSVLIIKPTVIALTLTVQFPASPTNGQIFTIVVGTSLGFTLINNGNGALVANGLTSFGFGLSQSPSASYIYYAPDNTWYNYN